MSRVKKVLFVGKMGGMCNVKYTFLQAHAENYGFAPEFCALTKEDLELLHRAGLPVTRSLSQAGIDSYSCVVLEDFWIKTGLESLSLEAVPVVQLWHGVPLKLIGFPEIASAVNMTPGKAAYLTANYSGYAAVPVTSEWMKDTLFAKAFRAEDFPELGFPRNDILLRTPTRTDMLGVDMDVYIALNRHRKNGGRVVVYMPTFRDTNTGETLDDILHLDELSAFCEEHNTLFVLKVHPNIQLRTSGALSNILIYGGGCDPYVLLPLVDLLVTDYSSIYFDFLFLDRPILFYAYDKEKYLSKDREMFFDYESMTPGVHVHTQPDLLEAMHAALNEGYDPCKTDRKALREKVFAQYDSLSAHRVCCYIRDRYVK